MIRSTNLMTSWRSHLWCVALLLLLLANGKTTADETVVVEKVIFEENVMVPMRDGVKLATNLYRKESTQPSPVLLMRTPYGKLGKGWKEGDRYVKAGFAVAVQDCRGRGKSEGEWDPFRYDAEDGVDCQAWIVQQPWCDGSLGTLGGSYVGWTQWAAAPDATDHLKAMVPKVPFANTYDDIIYPGGAFQLALSMGWGALVGGAPPTTDFQKAFGYLPLRTNGDQFRPKVPYLNQWITHHTYDDYWKKRGIDHRYSEVTVPILNIGGWYDIFSKATIDMVDRVREASNEPESEKHQYVIIGPWGHGVGVRRVGEIDFGEVAALNVGDYQLKFLQHWLQGEKTDVPQWPTYYLFVMGENVWRGENEWPLARTNFTHYYLHSQGSANSRNGNGTLSVIAPGDEPADQFDYDGDRPVPTVGGNMLIGAQAGPLDQSTVEERQDVLVYSTEPLESDVEVTGPVKAVIYASSTARDTDFTAKLVDVHPDGKAFNLCEGIIRGRYRNGIEQPSLMEPGQVDRFEIDMWVTSNLFKKGHRIRLQVSSSNYPRFDRNPNSGKPFGEDSELLGATQTIYHDAPHASHLLLPVIPR